MKPNRRAVLFAIMIITTVILAGCGRNAAQKSALPVLSLSPAGASSDGTEKAALKSQVPEDGSHLEAGSEFDITWHLTNTGTTTWTTDYCLRYFAGTDLTKPGKLRYNLTEPVAPGETGACSVDAVAPWEPGTYQMFVVLSNGNDENFSKVDITIVVDPTEEK